MKIISNDWHCQVVETTAFYGMTEAKDTVSLNQSAKCDTGMLWEGKGLF